MLITLNVHLSIHPQFFYSFIDEIYNIFSVIHTQNASLMK